MTHSPCVEGAGTGAVGGPHCYSTDFSNPDTGFTLPELTPKHFSFNSHLGACPACHGLGTELVCDADLMIPDRDKSLAEGGRAVGQGEQADAGLLPGRAHIAREGIPRLDGRAAAELPGEFQEALCHGTGERTLVFSWGENGKREKVEKPFDGLVASLQHLYETTAERGFTRQRIRQYMSRRTCSVCNGARLKPEILAVTIEGDLKPLNIHQFCRLAIADALRFVETLAFTEQQRFITSEVRREIAARLEFSSWRSGSATSRSTAKAAR